MTPRKASLRVIRGGSWNDAPRDCRPAYRNRYAAGVPELRPRVPRGRSPGIGPSEQAVGSALKRRPVGVEAEPTPTEPERKGDERSVVRT